MVDGAFDPLHRGHIEYFRVAWERLDTPLFCNVASNPYVAGKHPPMLQEGERAALEASSRNSTHTPSSTFPTASVLCGRPPRNYPKVRGSAGRCPPEPGR